jgi:hypothetical protein
MIPLYDVRVIHIEITNACNLECANCTRFVGHHKKPFMMDLDTVRLAISSLEGFPGGIGMMGGEPTIHPQFREICAAFREMIPDKNKRQFWTNGFKWKEYEEDIYETFYATHIHYNDHTHEDGVHQPLLIAAKDVVKDSELMWGLIDNCWVQTRWSGAITPKGGFFCEVAAAQDYLFDGPGGYPLEKGWWNKTPAQFQDQVKRYCENCSAAIPMPRPSHHARNDLVSRSVYEKLQAHDSPRFKRGNIELFESSFSKEEIERCKEGWTPWSHRPFKQLTPEVLDISSALVTIKPKKRPASAENSAPL